MSRNYYTPQLGDIVQLTHGHTAALVISVFSNTGEAKILYAESGHIRTDPFCKLHRWEGDVTFDTITKWRGLIWNCAHLDKRSAEGQHLLSVLDSYEAVINNGSPFGGATTTTTAMEGNEMTKVLYTWKTGNTVNFGHKLAVTKDGSWVMEPKAGGDVVTVDKKTVEEVMPYTVDVVYVGGTSAACSFFAKEGDFAVGDIVAHPKYSNLLRVEKLDTKSKKAAVWLYGTKLHGTAIESGE